MGSDSSLSLVPRKWQVKLQFHVIVQDSTNLDDVPVADAVEEEVTTAPTAPGDVQCPEARHDIVAGLRPRYAKGYSQARRPPEAAYPDRFGPAARQNSRSST